MDSRLNAFLERAESVLARIEPLLPAPRPVIDWGTCLAARWQRDGRSGYLLPLEVSLDMRLSDLIGMYKELLDASPQGRGSGFSFNDIAADKAGVRLGRIAVQQPQALQARMAEVQADTDLLPDVRDLPEFLTAAQLQQRYGGIDAPAYRAVMQDIDRRIAQTPALR